MNGFLSVSVLYFVSRPCQLSAWVLSLSEATERPPVLPLLTPPTCKMCELRGSPQIIHCTDVFIWGRDLN